MPPERQRVFAWITDQSIEQTGGYFYSRLLLMMVNGSLGFVVMLLGAGAATGLLAILPFAMTIRLYALELLVAFLQAYVFAMLTCMYLNDALHPGGH